MNKKLITLAVASALVAPAVAMADATLYGKIHVSLDYVDVQDNASYNTPNRAGFNGWDLASRASRLGVKGSEDLGNGLKAIYQIEMQIAITDAGGTIHDNDQGSIKMRNTFVGLASNWGTLLAGRHDTPMKVSTGKLDMFADTLADFNNIVGFQDIRADSTIAYISPSFAGFQFAGAVVPSGGITADSFETTSTNIVGYLWNVRPWLPVWGDETTTSSYNVDADGLAEAWSVAGIYSNGPLYASLAYESMSGELLGLQGDNAEDFDKWRVGLGLLDWNGFTLSGVYESWDDYMGIPDADADLWQIQAGYAFGNNMIKGAYGQNDIDNAEDIDSWVIGVDHNFSKRTKAYLLYTQLSDDNADDADWDGWSLGMVHSF
ncbi:outer membrane protein (porin) [Thioflavicoccus mobilis 8321]|uniref:Outer membrane protein (Porin) n=1 Tax=Thioflavicoccus mobilis 8321 TaxID=765912 RepID=L0GXA5_9GAMM|nr:porin [Thioflavicoccus mobilis]AGA89985.1 outer membrane protein (porin) [Thioflavicoccus mobilis 8321]